MSSAQALSDRSGAKQRWIICGMMFAATVLNYLDRQTMSVCAKMIKEDFSLSNEEVGHLHAAFRGTYAVAHVVAGLMADRFSVRWIYATAVGIWSAAGAAAAAATSSRMFGWTRSVLGFGEAFNWPCALRVTADLMPPEDRALANGFFASGAAVGAMLAPVLIMPMALAWGWRTAFVVIGALGALWIPLWLTATRRLEGLKSTEARALSENPRPNVAAQLRAIFANPGFWLLMLFAGTINPCSYIIADWIPLYMHEQRGFDLLAAAFIATPMFLGFDFGNIAGGAVTKYLSHRGWTLRQARGVAVAVGALLIVPAAGASFVHNAYVGVALLVLAATGIAWISANYLAALQEVSFGNVALTAGILGGFGNLVSWKINPLIGQYVDRTGNYHLVFVALGLMPLIGLAAILLFDWVSARRESRKLPE